MSMSLLLAFALSWAILRAVEQAGADTPTGLSRVRRAARERARHEAAARAARIRRSGTRTEKAALWAGTRGIATARATGRGMRATGRGVREVSRSAAAGWRSGWAEGKDRHAAYTRRRQRRRADRSPTSGPHGGPYVSRADGSGAVTGAPEEDEGFAHRERVSRGVGDRVARGDPKYGASRVSARHDDRDEPDIETPGRPAGHATQALPEGERTVSVTTTGEAPNIEAARQTLKAIADEAEQANTAIDSLSASLASADMDSQTLQEVSEILEAVDGLKTAADHALAGMDSRHQVMEEAVNSTPHAAKTEFYRH